MRQIGTLASNKQATTFEDYLLARGIRAMTERDGDEWAVWIYDEDQLETAKEELDKFQKKPDDPTYDEAARTARAVRKETEKADRQLQHQVVHVREQWSRPLPSRCPVTLVLIAVSLIVAWASQLGDEREPWVNVLSIAAFHDSSEGPVYYLRFRDIRDGELWRLVTPIFLHFGILHIVGNMLWMRELGVRLEFRVGSLRYLLIVLLIAVTSNVSQYLWSGPTFGGMSGVVFGLFGYIWMKSKYDPETGLYIHPNTVFLMLAWFLICFTGAVGPIANTAHGVGLGVGMTLGYSTRFLRELIRGR